MIVGTAAGENRLARTPEKPLAQGFVALQRRQQIRPVVITGGVPVQLGAVADDGASQMLTEKPQPFDQGMDRPQGRPGNIVGVDLIAAHHQQRRTLAGQVLLRQQLIDAQQAVGRRVMGFAAGTVQQLLDARTQDEVRATRIAVQQVRRPIGDAFPVFQ
ncbi:hypothetical protein D9M71_680910 [compost metagenome]